MSQAIERYLSVRKRLASELDSLKDVKLKIEQNETVRVVIPNLASVEVRDTQRMSIRDTIADQIAKVEREISKMDRKIEIMNEIIGSLDSRS